MMMMMMMMMMNGTLPVGKLEVWPGTKGVVPFTITYPNSLYEVTPLLTTLPVGRGHLPYAFGLFMCWYGAYFIVIDSEGLVLVWLVCLCDCHKPSISDDWFLGFSPKNDMQLTSHGRSKRISSTLWACYFPYPLVICYIAIECYWKWRIDIVD